MSVRLVPILLKEMRSGTSFPIRLFPGEKSVVLRERQSNYLLASACRKAHCWCVRMFTKMMVQCSKHVGTRIALGARKPTRLCQEGPVQAPQLSCLPPSPVPCPGITRCCATLLCYAWCVPMRPAAHSCAGYMSHLPKKERV